jgi:tetratricopeptide (TPR) repeat protein
MQITQHTTPRLENIYGLIRKGQFQAAFTELLHLDPRFIASEYVRDRYYYAKGRCLYGMGQFEEAIKAYLCVSFWHMQPKALNCLAYCYQQLGQQDTANDLFQQETMILLLELGSTYLDAGLFMKALRAFQAIPSWQDSYAAINGVHCASAFLGLTDQAQSLREEIALKWPEQDEEREYQQKLNQPALYPRFFEERLNAHAQQSKQLTALDLQMPTRRL